MGRTTTAKLQRWERTNYTVIIVVEERVKAVVEPDGTPSSATTLTLQVMGHRGKQCSHEEVYRKSNPLLTSEVKTKQATKCNCK
jgi:hypothetical protein